MSIDKLITCAKVPCRTCPYRKDVPSGVWHADEYDKLPRYDGEMWQQASAGALLRFDCHLQNGRLCAGWVGTHGPANLLALRILQHDGVIDPAVMDYQSPVPLFASGEEACEHGKRDIRHPNKLAREAMRRLRIKQARREGEIE